MSVERVHADPRVEADQGRVALRRGPLVYCLEGIDNGDNLPSLVLASGTPVKQEFRNELLGGAEVIHGKAERIERAGSGSSEWMETFTAIPYYLNSNRERSEMAVWMAETPSAAKACLPQSLASNQPHPTTSRFPDSLGGTIAALPSGFSTISIVRQSSPQLAPTGGTSGAFTPTAGSRSLGEFFTRTETFGSRCTAIRSSERKWTSST